VLKILNLLALLVQKYNLLALLVQITDAEAAASTARSGTRGSCLLSLLVQKYLLSWYKSINTGVEVAATAARTSGTRGSCFPSTKVLILTQKRC
jgi:hypothetical protein